MNYKELVEFMVKSLVDNPDNVNIREIEGEKSTIGHSVPRMDLTSLVLTGMPI